MTHCHFVFKPLKVEVSQMKQCGQLLLRLIWLPCLCFQHLSKNVYSETLLQVSSCKWKSSCSPTPHCSSWAPECWVLGSAQCWCYFPKSRRKALSVSLVADMSLTLNSLYLDLFFVQEILKSVSRSVIRGGKKSICLTARVSANVTVISSTCKQAGALCTGALNWKMQ